MSVLPFMGWDNRNREKKKDYIVIPLFYPMFIDICLKIMAARSNDDSRNDDEIENDNEIYIFAPLFHPIADFGNRLSGENQPVIIISLRVPSSMVL